MTAFRHRASMQKPGWYFFAWLAVANIVLIASGCHDDECEAFEMKCEGNRLMWCSVPSGTDCWGCYAKWTEFRDCSIFNATCQEGENIEFYPGFSNNTDVKKEFNFRSHGCAVKGFTCDGDTDMQCSDDNSLIVGCSYSHGPAAMIIVENESNFPFCVERSNGLAGFAHLGGECQSPQETSCINERIRVNCYDGLWSMASENCIGSGENFVCDADTDANGYSVSQCVPVDP